MQNKKIVILAGISLILAFGLVNAAFAHTGIINTLPSPNRADYVYSTLNVPCSTNGWNTTSPGGNLMGDVDADGICDGWERNTGLFIDFTPPAGYPGFGQKFNYSYGCDPYCPSRDKKDVYLELDWMKDSANSHVPQDGVVQAVIDAWAAAPVSNPNGTTGITLHVQYGEWPAANSNQRGDIQWHNDTLTTNTSYQSTTPGFYRLKQHTFGTMDERFADGGSSYAYNGTFQKNSNYVNGWVKNTLTAKFQVFHYDLIINKRAEAGQSTSSGWAEVWGNDHVWSLGGWTPVMGNASVQKAVFMHELGHNFNLDHGGGNNVVNYKPNYISVMNPVFQFESPDPCRPLDYSNKAMNSLDENSLTEANGVRDSGGAGYLYPSSPWSCSKSWSGNAAGASLADQLTPVNVAGTERFLWYSTLGSTTLNAFDRTNQSVNWNNDVPFDDSDAGVSQSINADGTKQTLTSFNDWTNLKFEFNNSTYAQNNRAADVITDPDAPPSHGETEDCGTDEVSPFQESYTTGCREVLAAEEVPPDDGVAVILSPRQQELQGILPENVTCKPGLVLMLKITNHAACVTLDTAEQLVLRGWGNIR